MHKKILAVLLVMLIGITMLTGCAENNETGGVSSELLNGGGSSETAITIKDKLKHSKIGLMSGSLVVPATEKLYPEAEILQFNDWGERSRGFKSGKS